MKYWKRSIVPAVWGIAFGLVLIGLGTFPESEAWGIHPSSRVSESRILQIFREQLPRDQASLAPRLTRALLEFSKRYRMDPAFVLSVIHVESTFKPYVVSPVGAIGLMQVMPATAEVVARRYKIPFYGRGDLFNPVKNLEIGMCYMKELLDRYKGQHPYYALAAYNMGPAKLNKLLAKPGFKPRATLKYYQDVTRGVDRWRFYDTRFYGAKKLEMVQKTRHGYELAENISRRPALGRP